MLKNRWILLLSIIIIILFGELIFFFIRVNKKSLNNNTITSSTTHITKGSVINTIISGNISTIELGTISIPLSSDTGEIIITGILKNVYEKNNKIYADILFEDNTGNIHETKNIVLIPNNQIPFTLEKLPTPQFIDPNHNAIKYQTVTFSQIDTLKQYFNKTFIFYFNTLIPDNLNAFPPNTRKYIQETNPYYKCNRLFLKSLQNHNFVFPDCNLYTNIGGIYVEKNK